MHIIMCIALIIISHVLNYIISNAKEATVSDHVSETKIY